MLRVNTKDINPGDTFLALKTNEEDGHDYIEQAIDKGAACIIADHGEYSVKTIIVKDTRTYLSNYLKELYFEKIDKIRIIGIIGTAGKTTVGDIACQLLNSLESKTAFYGTNGFYLNNELKNDNYNLDIYEIYECINKSIDNNCDNIIIEISSKDIEQRRIEGIKFDMIIYTNFIPYTSNNEENQHYINTKIEVLKNLKKDGIAIINKNDQYHNYFALPQNHNIFYGSKDSEYQISNIGLTYDFTEFNLNEKHIEIPLIGSFNIYNYIAAYVLAINLHYPSEAIINATEKLNQIDGRYQKIKYKNNLIIIDYAKDISRINNVITKTKEFSKAKLITIIGSDGDENKQLRPQIASLVTSKTDHTIFTTSNPRHEEPEDIINDMTKDLKTDNYEIIVSRKEAIKKGIEILEENDILLILGKGQENYQIIGNDRFTYKDYHEVLKHIKR